MKLKKAIKKLNARIAAYHKMCDLDKKTGGKCYRKPGSMSGRK